MMPNDATNRPPALPSDTLSPMPLHVAKSYTCRASSDTKIRQLMQQTSLPPLARSHVQRPLGRILIVRVEFVYTEDSPKPARTVNVRGDWNDWKEIALSKEEGRTWSVVTPLPTGYHEFQFVVDGVPLTSSRHPTARGDNVNWRNVIGPPQADSRKNSNSVHRWTRNAFLQLGLVTELDDDFSGLDHLSPIDMALPNTIGKPKRKFAAWIAELGIVGFFVVALSAYLICLAFYALVFGQ